MQRVWQRLLRGRGAGSGQTLVIYAILMPVLVGMAGLGLDVGQLYFERQKLQAIADAAAVTGAQVTNYDRNNPLVLPAGVDQARANAQANGPADIVVDVNHPPEAGLYLTEDFIEVIISRDVQPWFMGVFGMGPTTVTARAVARCFVPGYGVAAVLALSNDPEAITMNGGGGTGSTVIGDMISFGGMRFNSSETPPPFYIHGSVFALSQPAPTNMTLVTDPGQPTSASYGTDTGFSLDLPADPVVQGSNSDPISFAWPDWVDAGESVSGTNCMEWKEPDGPDLDTNPDEHEDCDGNLPNIGNDWYDIEIEGGTYTGGLTVPNGKTVTFEGPVHFSGTLTVNGTAIITPGYYGELNNNGTVTMASGVYTFGRMDLGNNSSITGDGVVIKLTDSSNQNALNVPGSASFSFTAYKPYTAGNPPPSPPTCSPYPCNTWEDIVVYAPNGDINLQGSGGTTRSIVGSIYAPNGDVGINGSGSGVATAVVQGQVIASTVTLGGNGPVVAYTPDGAEGTFGPVLVNTPNMDG